MIIDKFAEFSDAQGPVSASAASTNIMDLGAAPTLRDLGAGEPIWFVCTVNVTGTGAGTLTIQLLTDSVTTIQTTPHIHYQSPAFVGTDMVAGRVLSQFVLPTQASLVAVPTAPPSYERYMGAYYTIASTVGAVLLDAYLTKNPQANVSYPSGFTAS